MQAFWDILGWVSSKIGHDIPQDTSSALYAVFHIILIWAPLVLVLVILIRIVKSIRKAMSGSLKKSSVASQSGLPGSVFQLIFRHTRRDQINMVGLGIISLPVLYITLELPKRIINRAIDGPEHTTLIFGLKLTQTEHLLFLCGAYLAAIMVSGLLKYWVNVYKGKVGERLLRRLRLEIYYRWRGGSGTGQRSEVIPIVTQEVEPIGGFASEAFALPVLQGGTFLTILTFMFLQDPYLGAAAVALLPFQLALIPRLQRKVNLLARERMIEVRNLSGQLGAQAIMSDLTTTPSKAVGASMKEIERLRLSIHRAKFFAKSLNNFLSSLTPFFFYAVGGYLVINDQLSLGALVAVIAAYKDFSAPLRELFQYYQNREDVKIRYDGIDDFLGKTSRKIVVRDGVFKG
ncbi:MULTISPECIES: ABC transporter ATP-binding protein [unclassified Sulfitobacter]|jgi:ABC-type multidrug transport system fused ATPase/permease subunit|uniref:ABC transporter ATP-binding protein n=1 Tax=unclassified Sulfitobacter TaxID=196795 RepID=UPI00374663C2|tara:strand:+ start:3036 stop:4244 length:1209 start_codon:yes stop_codon:yes gene_type:complete